MLWSFKSFKGFKGFKSFKSFKGFKGSKGFRVSKQRFVHPMSAQTIAIIVAYVSANITS